MADIELKQQKGRRKTAQPRLDLTPMVDLGFILITFFIYTTSLAQPNAMEVRMPYDGPSDAHTVYPEESTVTLIAIDGHKVVYYCGALQNKEQLQRTTIGQVRDLLIKKKNAASALPATFSAEAHKLHVLIKPGDNCKYEGVVKLLDEMQIVAVPVFTLADLSAVEAEWAGL